MAATQSNSFHLQPALGTRPLPTRVPGGRSAKSGLQPSRLRNSCRHTVTSTATTDLHLVRQAIAGDPNAQEQLFEKSAVRLYLKAFSILRNREDAQDALQDSWYQAYNNLRSFEGRSSFSTWLTQIVINSALMILRRNRRRCEVSADEAEEASFVHEIPDRSPDPEQILLAGERNTILHNAIGGLRPRIRMIVECGPLQGRSSEEAAQRLGISSQAAKGRLFHARAALRKSEALKAIALREGDQGVGAH